MPKINQLKALHQTDFPFYRIYKIETLSSVFYTLCCGIASRIHNGGGNERIIRQTPCRESQSERGIVR